MCSLCRYCGADMTSTTTILSCKVCHKYSTTVQSHFNRHTTRCKRDCDLCEFKASSSVELRRHQINDHGITDGLLQCDLCEYTTKGSYALNQHRETHEEERQRLQCALCDRSYLNISSLNRHVRDIHKSKSNHESNGFKQGKELAWKTCPQDGCTFETSHAPHLYRHLRTVHSASRPYKCDVCDKTYKLKTHLNRHIKICWPVLIHRKFACDVCEYKAKTADVLAAHKMTHKPSHDKPYKCDICDRSFAQRQWCANGFTGSWIELDSIHKWIQMNPLVLLGELSLNWAGPCGKL